MTRRRRAGDFAIAVLVGALLAGCASVKPYHGTGEPNVRFTTSANSGSMFTSMRTLVHVYSVGTDCRKTYEGMIELDRPTVETGIPAGRPSYLEFVFASSSFLSNRRSAARYGTLLTPRGGRRYDIAVKYADDTYNAVVREGRPGRRARREVAHRPISACRPSRERRPYARSR